MSAATASLAATSEQKTTLLFEPYEIRGVHLKNRVVMSPMCQFSSVNGFANEWHETHLASRAVGGAGLIFVEATSVTPDGRITPGDMGLWDDAHIAPLARIAGLIERFGSVPGIQLAHAGRKGARHEPWNTSGPIAEKDSWRVVSPSALAFDEDNAQVPRELGLDDIEAILVAFEKAALRAVAAGFRVIELHAGHGYLFHAFLSPISNKREDHYGGSLDGRMRFLLEAAERVRSMIPKYMPLFVRISATDWVPDERSWDVEQSVVLASALKKVGVDLIDISSGGATLRQKIVLRPGYQVPFSQHIRKQANVATAAVGLITEPQHASDILRDGDADLVFIGRALLHNPYWVLAAQQQLLGEAPWPKQYGKHALRRNLSATTRK